MSSIMRYRPYASWPSFRGELDRLFENMMPEVFKGDSGDFDSSIWTPKLDFSETDKAYTMNMELPGIDKKDVVVNVEERMITVTGERKAEKKEENRDYHRIERSYGRFFRSMELPKGALADKAVAKFKDGVLTVTIPKAEEKKPHRVVVK